MRLHSIHILVLFSALALACTNSTTTAEIKTAPSPAATVEQKQTGGVEEELERRLKILSEGAQGKVGLSVIHIESGKTISINGKSQLPLYSVFKLPVAIVVLKEIEVNHVDFYALCPTMSKVNLIFFRTRTSP